MVGCIPQVLALLLTPILTCIQAGSQLSYISYKKKFRVNNRNILFQKISFVFCIFCEKSDIQRKHFPEVPRGEPFVFGNGSV